MKIRSITWASVARLKVSAAHFLAVASIIASTFSCQAQEAPSEATPRSTVYYTRDPNAVVQFEEDPQATRRMVDRLIIAATGTTDVRAAWKTLVGPKDTVGIKVAATGGQYFSSHRGLVDAIAAGLQQAGVAPNRIIVWDRSTAQLREAGFLASSRNYVVRGIDPPKGLDPKSTFFAPAFGKLIDGDLSFRANKGLKKVVENEQISPDSHLPFLLMRDLTKIINVATLSDEPGCGIAGTLYNVTVPIVDNNRRFTQSSGVASIADLYLEEHIGPKVVMHFIDGLVGQFAAGPGFSPNYSFAHGTIYAGKDPVALDTTALAKLETWRQQSKLPPIGKLASWLSIAEDYGVGNHDTANIDVVEVRPK